jgi:hypothetical protein
MICLLPPRGRAGQGKGAKIEALSFIIHELLRARLGDASVRYDFKIYCSILVNTGAGITRLLQVLYRINFLTIVLCLCMNRPYQFYYFPPLVSFWYLGQGSLSPLNIVP